MATQFPAFDPVNVQITATATVTRLDENMNRIQTALSGLRTSFNDLVSEYNTFVAGREEVIEDTVAAMFTGGFHNGITYTYDDANGVINSTVVGTTPPIAPGADVSGFTIDIPSAVRLNTDLNTARTVTFTVRDVANINSLTLNISDGDNKSLTVPANDGTVTQTVTLTSVNTASAGTLTFQIRGVTTGGSTIMSNTVSVVVRDVVADEQAYYGTSATNNPDTIDTATLTAVDVTPPGRTYDIELSVNSGEFLIILEPADRPITSIFDRRIMEEGITAFTKTDSVRNINSQAFNSYVLTNNGATSTFSLRVTHA